MQSEGTAAMSFTSLNLRTLDDFPGDQREEQEAIVKAAAANMYAAGADTTVSALGTFILGMLMNPEAQQKAQAELDSVVGVGHLPDFADEAALPYVSAIVKETLRWRNVTPIGSSSVPLMALSESTILAIPHCLAIDDEYLGHRIPAGSIVIGNAWFVHSREHLSNFPYTFPLFQGDTPRRSQSPPVYFLCSHPTCKRPCIQIQNYLDRNASCLTERSIRP
jgi:hypothetical protein